MIKGLRKKPYQHAMSKSHQQNAAKLQTEPQNEQEKVKGIARYIDISNNTLNKAVGVYSSLLSSQHMQPAICTQGIMDLDGQTLIPMRNRE